MLTKIIFHNFLEIRRKTLELVKNKLAKQPVPVDRKIPYSKVHEIITEYWEVCSDFSVIELKLILLADLLDVEKYLPTNNKIKNEKIYTILDNVFGKLHNINKFNLIYRAKLFYYKYLIKKLIKLRGSLLHCNFIQSGTLLSWVSPLRDETGKSIKSKELTPEILNMIPLFDSLLFLYEKKYLDLVKTKFSLGIDLCFDLINKLPQNLGNEETFGTDPLNDFFLQHKEVSKLLALFEYEFRALAQRKGICVFVSGKKGTESKKTEAIKNELRNNPDQQISTIFQEIDNIQFIRNRLIHLNFIAFIEKFELIMSKQYRGNVFIYNIPNRTAQNLSNIRNQSIQDKKRHATPGLLLEIYLSKVDVDLGSYVIPIIKKMKAIN